MLSRKNISLTEGPILKSIILYAIPVMLGTLVQVLFNAADLAVLRYMADDVAVASVGATSSIINLLVTSFVGLSVGVNVMLARTIGQKNDARASKIVNTSLIFSLALGILLAVGCAIFAKPLLDVTNCPDDCFRGAERYLTVYTFGIPGILVYNFGAAIIRTTGDTSRPFYYIVAAGILNVLLNVVMCFVLKEKVMAVAIATAASQFLGAVLVILHLARMNGACRFNIKKLSFSFLELSGILKIGAPSAFNSALFSLSNIQMQAAINSYGYAATAGNTAAATLESLASSFTGAFNAAAVPFIGQNIGANNKKRVNQSIICCSVVSTSVAIILSFSIYLMGEFLLGFFVESPDAIAFGMKRTKYVLLVYGICVLYNSFVNAMQAFGYSFVPMINSIVTVLIFRLFWLEFIYPVLEAQNSIIDNVYMCYTISWTLSLIAHSITFAIIYTRYRRGKIKQV